MKKRCKNRIDKLRLTQNPALTETCKQVTNPAMKRVKAKRTIQIVTSEMDV
jgi:hypothetical protein